MLPKSKSRYIQYNIAPPNTRGNIIFTMMFDSLNSIFNLQSSIFNFQSSIFKVVKEQGVALERRFALVLNLNAEFDFGLYSAAQIGNRSKVGNEAY